MHDAKGQGTGISMRRHTLLIDADDTLWQNNVFFEKLIEDFISIVESSGYTRAYIRHILNETERKNIRQYGYGVRSFGRSLEETYLKLADQMAKRETLALIHQRVIELERTPEDPRRRAGNSRLSDLTAPPDSFYEGRACRTGRESRTLRAPGILRIHRNRAGEKP
jgi:hypothetical protein